MPCTAGEAPKRLQHLVNALDSSKRGEVDFTILVAAFMDTAEVSSNRIQEVFGLFDMNQDGKIDAADLGLLISKAGVDYAGMIAPYDLNMDGALDLEEFSLVVTQADVESSNPYA